MRTTYEDGLRDGQWVAHRGIRVWQPNPPRTAPACPKCGVTEGECRTRNGYIASTPHVERRWT